MLLRDVEVEGARCSVRIVGDRIGAVGSLAPARGEVIVEGNGGALIPGLADQHIHLRALAAARGSVDVSAGLAVLADAPPRDGWIRGVGLEHSDLATRSDLDAV